MNVISKNRKIIGRFFLYKRNSLAVAAAAVYCLDSVRDVVVDGESNGSSARTPCHTRDRRVISKYNCRPDDACYAKPDRAWRQNSFRNTDRNVFSPFAGEVT